MGFEPGIWAAGTVQVKGHSRCRLNTHQGSDPHCSVSLSFFGLEGPNPSCLHPSPLLARVKSLLQKPPPCKRQPGRLSRYSPAAHLVNDICPRLKKGGKYQARGCLTSECFGNTTSRRLGWPLAAPDPSHWDIWKRGLCSVQAGNLTPFSISLLSGVSGQAYLWLRQMGCYPCSGNLGRASKRSGISFLLLSQTVLVDTSPNKSLLPISPRSVKDPLHSLPCPILLPGS